MAEIDMEVDVAQPLNFDGHADEDLIDYDIDTTEEHEPTAWPSHDDEPHPGGTAIDAQTDVSMGFDSKMSETATEPNEPTEAVGDGSQHENTLDDAVASDGNTSNRQSPSSSGGVYHDDDVDVFETEQTEELNEVDVGDVTTAVEAPDVENEIDYEDGDGIAEQESYAEQEEVGGDGDEGLKYDQDVRDNVPNTNPPSVTSQSPQNENASEPTVEDEITWEQGEGQGDDENATTHDETESHGEVGDGADETTSVLGNDGPEEEKSDAEAAESTEALDHSHEQYIGGVDFEHDDSVVELEEGDSATVQQEELTSQPEHPHTEEEDFPAITVQYRGEEFPFFSRATSEGFFSDPSVLDDSMEWLLARFRAELANEIAAEDELIFQVDELGLEFAESCLRDSLSNITLRGILDLFDLLVKNQDPESSRSLYTYLFTKPSTSKRFDFLMESAAAGKGLDEVIHLFESPMPQNASAIDENVDLDDIVTQPSEQYENEGDDLTNENQTDDVDYHDDNEASMDGIDEHVEENVEEDRQVDVEEHEKEHQQVESPAADPAVESDHQTTAQEPDLSLNATETNEHVDSDSNPFIHLEFDESGEVDADEIRHEDMLALPDHLDDENGNLSTAITSSTNMLADNGEMMSTQVVMNVEPTLDHEIPGEALADQDELAEIDWRDEPESTGGAGHNAPDTPSGVLKRPRTDDEQSMEEEQGVKRRRS